MRFEHRFPSIGKKVEEAGLELYKWERGQLAFADEPWVTPATMVTTARAAVMAAEEPPVFSLRYGLDRNGFARTLEEVGALTALSRQEVRDVEDRALGILGRA